MDEITKTRRELVCKYECGALQPQGEMAADP